METNNADQSPEENQNQQQAQQPQSVQQEEMQQEKAPEQGEADNQGTSNDVEENKAITYLSYLGLLFLVPMLVKKDSPFAQFHAKQGLVLTIAWFIGSFLYAFFGLGVLVHIALLVLSIMGLVNVSKGETKELPVVGEIAKKFNI